jgi:uncharacterized protein (TIGR00369 family)
MPLTADAIYQAAPFARTLGIHFDAMEAEEVRARLPYSAAVSTVGGGMHGGALMSLADVASAVCASVNGPAGALPSTAESSTHFMKPVVGRHAVAVARPLHRSGSSVVVQVDVLDEQDSLCARVTQVVVVRVPKARP